MMLRILPLKLKLTTRELKLTTNTHQHISYAMLLTNYVKLKAPINHLLREYRSLTLVL